MSAIALSSVSVFQLGCFYVSLNEIAIEKFGSVAAFPHHSVQTRLLLCVSLCSFSMVLLYVHSFLSAIPFLCSLFRFSRFCSFFLIPILLSCEMGARGLTVTVYLGEHGGAHRDQKS